MSSSQPARISLGDRWRREATRKVEEKLLELALETLPHVRPAQIRIRAGSIHGEVEGVMGSIHEVDIHVPTLPSKIWPQVARVLRRSTRMVQALRQGQVPRSFDRLVARIAGEPIFPEARRIQFSCTCQDPELPCRHTLAVHEVFSRRLEERPWELLVMRGVNLPELLEMASGDGHDLPDLAFGAREEPILFPEGEEGDLDVVLTPGQTKSLLGVMSPQVAESVRLAIETYLTSTKAEEPATEPSENTVV